MEDKTKEMLERIKKELPEDYVIINYAALKEECKKASEPFAKLVKSVIESFKIK